jgi:excisionase family DNA binding protein
MGDDQFLTTEEVLGYLQINLRTIYRLLKARQIPAVRVGRQWRFRRSDLDAWLAARGGNGRDPLTRPRILVVDDDQAVLELLGKSLVLSDYEVDSCTDGPTALERLSGSDYDLLIVDLKMPGMDGLSVIREARRRNLELPVIIVTGFSTEANAIEAINLGVSGYLTKPFRIPRLLNVAARALGEPPAETVEV